MGKRRGRPPGTARSAPHESQDVPAELDTERPPAEEQPAEESPPASAPEPDALSALPISLLELALNHFELEPSDLSAYRQGHKLLGDGRVKLYTKARGTLIWRPKKNGEEEE